ncbi:hypothetical protein [Neobacillus mesonae]|uniref:hypothetical protein n=1 Tax=Neobacillus mesonae TaxID=1193713 RepID=UPI00203AC98A|nr:hypothetical protein [Neobacillus mesonae]MCM3566868.1 hypothetical protein [Neobacillus mesonae]
MFDPTAFDNMKVVIEGALYDKDMDKEIVIIDRNDLLNSAKMSRKFNISFIENKHKINRISANINLAAGLENLGAELLPGKLPDNSAGCYVEPVFTIYHDHDNKHYQAIQQIFLGVWGELRRITQTVVMNPFEPQNVKNIVSIDFERLINEDQMDDLVEMIDFMISTLKDLDSYFSGVE